MENYIRINKIAYDELAEEYAERINCYKKRDKEILKFPIEYLKNNFERPKVLELGPGSGLALLFFENEGFSTTAIDISEKIIKIAKKVSPNTLYLTGNFLDYDFCNEKFDLIFAKAFIHLFPKQDAIKVMKKISMLLSKNGIAYVSTTIHENSEKGFFGKEDYSRKSKRYRKKWTEQELLSLIKDTRFKIFNKIYTKEKDLGKEWLSLTIPNAN